MSQGTPEKLLLTSVKKKLTEKPLTSSQLGALGGLATNAQQIAQVTQAAAPVQAQTRTVKLVGHGPELKKWKDRFGNWKVDVEPAFDAASSWAAFDQFMTKTVQALEALPMNANVPAEANRLVQAYVAGTSAVAAPSTGATWAVEKGPLIKKQPAAAAGGPRFPTKLTVLGSARKHRSDLSGTFADAGLPHPDDQAALVAYVGDGTGFGYVEDSDHPHFAYAIGSYRTKQKGGWATSQPWSILVAPDGRIFHYGPTGAEVMY